MNAIFAETDFRGDVSLWDVSRVTSMTGMFAASKFRGDIADWDVSNVVDMGFMFEDAQYFHCDISKWDVSKVTDMSRMFWGAKSFGHRLCGEAWLNSKADQEDMFVDSFGAIAKRLCRPSLTRRPSLTQRWLARWQKGSAPITTLSSDPMFVTCSNCGTFRKSGRVSCCAPGGAWYNKCGNAGNRNLGYSWLEGLEACKCKSKVYECTLMLLCTLDHDFYRVFSLYASP